MHPAYSPLEDTAIIWFALIVNAPQVVRIGTRDDVPSCHVDRPEDSVTFDYSSVAGTAELEAELAATWQPVADPGIGS